MAEAQGMTEEKLDGGEEGSKFGSTNSITAEGKKKRLDLLLRSPPKAPLPPLLDTVTRPATQRLTARDPVVAAVAVEETEIETETDLILCPQLPAVDPVVVASDPNPTDWFLGGVSGVVVNYLRKMARPQLIFVDGSLAELAQEMADYVQVGEQVKPLLEKDQTEEALQTIVKASGHLNSVPEKEFTASYNLLIHLVLQSQNPKKYLPTVCGNLLKPITSSPVHGVSLAANALSTIFNLLDESNPLRYNVFMQILRFIKQHNQYDLLKPRLKNLKKWANDWDLDEEDERNLYVEVADIAAEGGDEE